MDKVKIAGFPLKTRIVMTPYAQLPTHKPQENIRIVGLSQEDFLHLNRKLTDYLDEQKALKPLTKRGRKDSKLALEDRLLLTLYYLRHYPTLINLAAVFGISESYCHKIYTRTARMLAKGEKLPNRKALLEDPEATLVIDVSEQPIERPVKNQKAYYLRKMSNDRISFNGFALEAFNLPMLIVNGQHEIIETNTEALQLLENQQISLTNKAGCLTCKHSECKYKLAALISKATESTTSIGGGFLLADTDPWHVFVKPLKSPLSAIQPSQNPLAVVFVLDPTKNHNSSSLDLLAKLYNFSPAETAVANALLSGKTPEDYAKESYVAISTVRSHLKKLFIKTNTHRQIELVTLLNRLLPFRD